MMGYKPSIVSLNIRWLTLKVWYACMHGDRVYSDSDAHCLYPMAERSGRLQLLSLEALSAGAFSFRSLHLQPPFLTPIYSLVELFSNQPPKILLLLSWHEYCMCVNFTSNKVKIFSPFYYSENYKVSRSKSISGITSHNLSLRTYKSGKGTRKKLRDWY